MNLFMKKTLGLLAIATLIVPASLAFAQAEASPEFTELQNTVKELTKKVAVLESAKGTSSSFGSGYVMPTEGGESKGGLIHPPQDIDFGGYVATSYTEHIDQEGPRQAYVFDGNQGFAVNQANFWFKKDAPTDGGAGFKIEIMAGEDARVTEYNQPVTRTATGTVTLPTGEVLTLDGGTVADSEADDITFNEAYIDVNTPLNTGDSDILPSVVNWKVGRMITLAGREVIDPRANWNISRSVAFGYGLPFRHTGLRTNTKWLDGKLDFYAGINNGWDNSVETNAFRTLEFAAGFSPIENVKYFTTILWGPETADTAGHRTFLWTHVLDWSVTKALSLGFNIDWGHTNNPIVGGVANTTGNWQEFAGYARYQINDKWAGAYRMELFREGTSRGALGEGNQTIFGNTFTLEYNMYENLITRLEYRLDKANGGGTAEIFGGDSSRNTLAAQMIYTI